MEYIQIGGVVTDLLLGFSLIFLCYRLAKGSAFQTTSRQLLELEASLRGLLKEAEAASRSLNSELQKRQTQLEKLLFDVETVEQRLEKGIDSSEERRKELLKLTAEIEKSLSHFEKKSTAISQQAAQAEKDLMGTYSMTTPEPSSFENYRESYAPARQSNLNVYGEPVPNAASRGSEAQQRSALSKSIEKEIQPEFGSTGSGGIEDVYAAAEEMLAAGHALESVAARTSLPMDDLKLLSQMIAREKAATQQSQGTPAESAGIRRGYRTL
ncbi:MAG: hypothetical protein D6719_08360 [Candidatus Dadabacteria bacterium]|nr:MAG: hypothetical protein D6719_08360 [Candidatus Dadabacteria bacterium]